MEKIRRTGAGLPWFRLPEGGRRKEEGGKYL
jgi:hypothetical protein